MASPYEPPTESLRGEVPSAGSRIAAILAHLSAPIAALLSAGSLSLLGPLLVWLVMKRDPMARRAAAGAFNFNLAFWLLYLVSWLLIFTVIGAVIGIPLIIVLFVVSAWCHIKGAIRAAGRTERGVRCVQRTRRRVRSLGDGGRQGVGGVVEPVGEVERQRGHHDHDDDQGQLHECALLEEEPARRYAGQANAS